MEQKTNDDFMRNILIEEAWKKLSRIFRGAKLYSKNIRTALIGIVFPQTTTSSGQFL